MATTTPNVSPPTAKDPFITKWAALAAVLLVTAGLFALAYLHASAAADQARAATRQAKSAAMQAQKTAECVNNILGARAPLTNADHLNERQKIEDQIVAEKDKSRGLTELSTAKDKATARAGFEVYRKGVTEFIKALDDWKARDDLINAEKAQHPLGRC